MFLDLTTIDSMYSLSTFEHQLVMYVTSGDKQTFAAAFDVATVPVVSHEQALAEERTKKLTSATPTLKAPSAGPTKSKASGGMAEAATASATQKYAEQLMQHPDLKEYGTLLKSSGPVELSESETEYVVTAVKHIFKEHIVVQYDIKNTLPDSVLENVTVAATPEEEDVLEEDFIIPAPKLPTNEPGVVYVAFKKLGGENSVPVTSFTNNLKFTSKEIDPTTGEPEDTGYDDEYQVEDLELTGSDYVIPTFAGSFDHVWEQTGANGEEESETLQLSNMKGITGMYSYYLIFARDTNNFHRCYRTADRGPVAPTPRRHRRRPQQQHTHAQTVRQDRLRWPCRLSYQDGLLQQSRCHDQDHCPRRRGGCCRGCDCFCVLISLLYLFLLLSA
jgi:coatomer protein complex subunit gamma